MSVAKKVRKTMRDSGCTPCLHIYNDVSRDEAFWLTVDHNCDIAVTPNLGTCDWTEEELHRYCKEDRDAIGTDAYRGLAYFWAHEFRHTLRDASASDKRMIHREFLNAGLELNGETEEHFAIIKKYFPTSY